MLTIYPRLLLSLPKGSFFLFGPRGSGKSTWVSGLRELLASGRLT